MKKGETRAKGKGSKEGKPTSDIGNLITQKEAALIRGVTQAAIGDLIKRGRLRTLEMFGRVLVYRSEVEAFERERPGPKVKG